MTVQSKTVEEVILVQFDFGDQLPPTGGLASASLEVIVLQGLDEAPEDLINDAFGLVIDRDNVQAQLKDGVAGVTYKVICYATGLDTEMTASLIVSVLPEDSSELG